MRKILFLMAMLVCSLQFAMAGDVVTRDVNKLPVAAREMIGKHFWVSGFSWLVSFLLSV